nr:hypothetical protein [Tanacetum cinerariifolium]
MIHTVDTNIAKLVVEIESFSMGFDEFDQEIVSVDELHLGQADLSCVHALNELYFYEIRVVPSKHEADLVSCVQISNQFDISHKFAPLRRKSV